VFAAQTTTTRHNIGRVAFSWGAVDSNVYHSHCPPSSDKSECSSFPQVYNSSSNQPPPAGAKSKPPKLSTFKEWQASGKKKRSLCPAF
jgi:hypothetical protein